MNKNLSVRDEQINKQSKEVCDGAEVSTPNDIEILIHCVVSPSPHPRREAPAVQGTLSRYMADGIVEYVPLNNGAGDYFTATDKGRAWLAMICNVPYPTQQWVDEQGKPIFA